MKATIAISRRMTTQAIEILLRLRRRRASRMKETDSRECRGCHDGQSFDYAKQSRRAAEVHQEGLNAGQTCIDCHKGIAHQLPHIPPGLGPSDSPGQVVPAPVAMAKP